MESWLKQPVESFGVGDRIVNTQQVSYYFGKRGVVVALGVKGRCSIRVKYDDGSAETFKSKKNGSVWLRFELDL